jgi:voltage-gated potassium channel Kch
MAAMLLVGMVFYHFVEHWSWLDSLYFCVVSLATVGYGDLVPTEPISKIFTMIYLLNGLAMFVSFVHILAQQRTRLRKAKEEGTNEDNSAN